MNYFNYFTEIEETFIRRRGKHLLLSPMDWALIESWKEKGVPLHVALRGIEHAFDSFEAKPRKRSVKTLFYCQEEVEAQYAEWLEAQLGASPTPEANGERTIEQERELDQDAGLPFPRTAILTHLSQAQTALLQLSSEQQNARSNGFYDALNRAVSRLQGLKTDFAQAARPDAEKLEESLTSLEKLLDEALRASISKDELAATLAAAEEQLHPYRSRMDKETYEQTLDNLLKKRVREQHGVPRLSLFYL